jgi:hypothetical protein
MGQGKRVARRATAALALAAIAGSADGVAVASNRTPAAASATEWTFVSAPQLHPTKPKVLVRKPGLGRGYFLTAAQPGFTKGEPSAQAGPLMMDSRARPVWFLPLNIAFYLQQGTYQGKPVLLVFDSGLGRSGSVLIYDEHYRQIAALQARSPWSTDLHDASIVGGNIWITVSRDVKHEDLARYGGPRDATVQDMGLQEFQISTGRLLRTWDALNPGGRANVPLSASYQRPPKKATSGGWDAYHLNSVQALPNGDLLVSMRNTWSVYLLDPVRHKILWTLGGKSSSLHVPRGARFAWQHDARLVHPATEGQGRSVQLTLFNDNTGHGASSGLILRLDTFGHRAKLLAAYRHHPPYYSVIFGSMQALANGNALVGWGSPDSYFTEYSHAGKQLLDVAWPFRTQSYRTLFTSSWVGTPYYPPRGAVRGKTVYASWNGATRVARWQALGGSSVSALKVVATRARTGFETALGLGQTYRSYEVRALSASGRVLGTSGPFSPS